MQHVPFHEILFISLEHPVMPIEHIMSTYILYEKEYP